LQTLRWREMDSNFQYAGAVNLVVGPFGWVVLRDRMRSGRGASGYNAVSATGLGDLSRRSRGGPSPVGPILAGPFHHHLPSFTELY